MSTRSTGAFLVFTCFYVVCALVTWCGLPAPPGCGRPRHEPGRRRDLRWPRDTHCPYCSLQCGMTLERAGRALRGRGRGRSSRSTRARCAARAGPPPGCAATASGSPRRWCGTARPASCGRRLGRGARPRRRPARRAPRRARPRRGGGLRRRRADQREGLPARQVRPGRAAAPARSTTTAAGACRRPRRPATGPSASTGGCRSRWPTSEQTDVLVLVGVQPGRDDAAGRPAPRPAARARREGRRGRPAAHPTAERADLVLQPVPGTDLAARPRPAAPASIADGAVDEEYVAARTTGFDDVRRVGGRLVARAGRAGHRRAGRRAARGSPRLLAGAEPGHGAHRPRRRAARPGHGHRARPGSTSRSRSGMPGRPCVRLRLPHRPGQRPGRPRARPEGRPAARLPDDRRPGGARARRRRLGRRRRTSLPGPGARRTSCSTRSAPAAARRRCWCSAATSSSPRPAPATSSGGSAALDLLVVADLVLSETAACADVVLPVTQWAEETGTMTNLEGRVILRQRAVAAARRGAQRPRRARRAGRAAGLPGAVRRPTPRRSSTSCAGPPPAGRPTTPASPTTGSARSGRVLALPAPDHAGTPADVPRRLRHPGRAGALPRRRAPRRGRAAVRGLPGAPDHRPGARAVPVRRADPPGPRRSPDAGAFVEMHPMLAGGSGPSTATRVRVATRRGDDDRAGPGRRDDPPGHRVRAVPLGRRPTGSPTTRSTRPRGCRSSRSAPRRCGS